MQESWCERGITVTHEAIRPWGLTFGPDYANQRTQRRPRTGDTWHRDEGCVTLNGKRPDLGRAVEQAANVRAMLGQSRRHKPAAKKFVRKLLKGLQDVPRGLIPAQLTRSGAAQRESLPGVEHRQSR